MASCRFVQLLRGSLSAGSLNTVLQAPPILFAQGLFRSTPGECGSTVGQA